MEPLAVPSLAAIVVADQADAKGAPCALEDIDGAPALAKAMMALDFPNVGPRFVVLGCGADDVRAQVNMPGWEILENDHWKQNLGYGVCVGMESLPLIDGFLLALCGHSNSFAPTEDVVKRLGEQYVLSRRSLGRVVIPIHNGQRCWPWLIDIGFREPFQKLAKGGTFESILEANASQVVELKIDA